MSDNTIIDISAVRFSKNTDPDAHEPVAALYAAIAWIEEAKAAGEAVDHVIVNIGRTTDAGASGTRYFQAGKYPYHAQIGLCSEVVLMIRGSND